MQARNSLLWESISDCHFELITSLGTLEKTVHLQGRNITLDCLSPQTASSHLHYKYTRVLLYTW